MGRRNGFTLIEVLVSIVIMGILAGVSIPIFLHQRTEAWKDNLMADVQNAAIQVKRSNMKSNDGYTTVDSSYVINASDTPTVSYDKKFDNSIGAYTGDKFNGMPISVTKGNKLRIIMYTNGDYDINGSNIHINGRIYAYHSSTLTSDWEDGTIS